MTSLADSTSRFAIIAVKVAAVHYLSRDGGENPFREPFKIQDFVVAILSLSGLTTPLEPIRRASPLEFDVCLQQLQELNEDGQKKPASVSTTME
jgi:hypothetical protein